MGGGQRRGGGIRGEGRFLNKGHMILLVGHDSIGFESLNVATEANFSHRNFHKLRN